MSAPDTPPLPEDEPRKATRPASRSTPSATTTGGERSRRRGLTVEDVEDETRRNDFMIRWAVVLLALLVATTPVFQTDALVHVKTGEHLAGHGFLPPRTDVFSYTTSDRTWANTEWLYDLVAYAAHALGGPVGLTVLKALLAAITFGLVVHTCRTGVSTWWASICAAVAVMLCPLRFSALPESITLLGLALTLWLLVRWRQTGASLWPLVGVFLLWANMDQRMFLGLAVLVLYGLGELVNGALASPAAFDTREDRRTFWLVTGACVLAALVNPFGWESLLSPVRLYATDYPAARAIFGDTPSFRSMQFYPMTTAGYLRTMDIPGVCGLFLLGAAFVASALNHRRLDVGVLLVLTAFTTFAFAATHELAAAGLVAAVLGSLAASDWYSERSGPVSTSLGAIAFARGGRVLTVLGLIAIALLSINGRLAGTPSLGLGVGLHPDLRTRVESLANAVDEVPVEYRAFNTGYTQGDLLVWLGRPVFVDSRYRLFAERNGRSVIVEFERARQDLARDGKADEGVPRASVLDEYGVDVALPAPGRVEPTDEYRALFGSPLWRQVAIGGNEVVFVRYQADPGEGAGEPTEPGRAGPHAPEHVAARNEFATAHEFDPVQEAFRRKGDPVPQRADIGRPPSDYAAWLFPRTPRTTADLERSRSLALYTGWLAAGKFGAGLNRSVLFGNTYLTQRESNRALADDPQISEGYRLLGHSRWLLGTLIEPQYFPVDQEGRLPSTYSGVYEFRRLQAVNELMQALFVDEENLDAHHSLILVYSSVGQHELVLRHVNTVRDLAEQRKLEPQGLPFLEGILDGKAKETLIARIEPILQEARERLDKKAPVLQVAQFLFANGCTHSALALLEEALGKTPEVQTDFAAQILYARLLLEYGAVERASDQLAAMEQFPEATGNNEWRRLVAIARASAGRHADAIEMLQAVRADLDREYYDTIFGHLPFVASPVEWPDLLPQVVAARQLEVDDAIADWNAQWYVRFHLFTGISDVRNHARAEAGLLAMLLQIESGRLDDARRTVRELLDYPEGHMTNLTRQYAQLLGVDLPRAEPEPENEP